MGNRVLQLYVDNEDIEIAKSKGINLSSFFRENLKLELYKKEKYSKEEENKKLKNKIALLIQELIERDKEIIKIKKGNNRYKVIPFQLKGQ